MQSKKRESISEVTPQIKNINETWWFPVLLILISIVISAIIGYIVFQIQWSDTAQKENKNLANGFLIEIEHNEHYLKKLSDDFQNPQSTRYNPTKIVDPLYPDYGLFYAQGSDISKFDPKLSKKLYNYYYNILRAESDRKLFNEYYYETDPNKIEENPKLLDDVNYKEAMTLKQPVYEEMKKLVINCSYDITDIKDGLNNYIKS